MKVISISGSFFLYPESEGFVLQTPLSPLLVPLHGRAMDPWRWEWESLFNHVVSYKCQPCWLWTCDVMLSLVLGFFYGPYYFGHFSFRQIQYGSWIGMRKIVCILCPCSQWMDETKRVSLFHDGISSFCWSLRVWLPCLHGERIILMRQIQEKEPKMCTILAIRVDSTMWSILFFLEDVVHSFCDCAMVVQWITWWLALGPV